ncbi:Predicted PurR-regulated permease PerM [Amphibacillus marinus]|uniref:Predicted PurR-regulated permease PerM n=1 Tax=Amphibacillus marinus TaxID=872970 RepID=A0A1H8MXU0_9BACI|nr:AI-2E family transporter [Amphibacillus marinus]SEO22177.1 Predicted PurR-regulated permease PerM [Amphibacillus marinus]
MLEQKPFKFLVYTILIFTLIFLINLTGFVFYPVGRLIAAIAVPIIGAGFLFYITNPFVNLLEKYKVKRIFAVLIVFLVLILIVFFSIYFIVPPLQEQFSRLVDNAPQMATYFEDLFELWQNRQEFIPASIEDSIQNVLDNFDSYAEAIMSSLFSFIGSFFSFVFSFVLIPFFLFFMLKDGQKFIPFISSFLSKSKADSLAVLLKNINITLASFIQGQFFISFCLGILLYIGYLIVGLNYALMLAIFGLFMNMIPFVGPWIAAVPAIIIGFFQDPMIGVWTAVIMIVAQQLESIISPNIMGKVLKIHPLTVLTLILTAGSIAGFIGLLFAVPAYAVARTIVNHFYLIYTNKRPFGKKNLF